MSQPSTSRTKDLIVNADDFGLTPGVNEGIVQGFQAGILTSATLMANGAAFDDAIEKVRQFPGLGVGVHLCLVNGRAVASPDQIPSLVDEHGELHKTLFALFTRLSGGLIPIRQIECEFRAQIARIVDAGVRPSHLDTHKHTHVHPTVMKALGKVANEFGIRYVRKPFEDFRVSLGNARSEGSGNGTQVISAITAGAAAPWFRSLARSYGLTCPDHFFGVTVTGRLSSQRLAEVLKALPAGKSELMCHPGVCDDELRRTPTRLKQQRQLELDALTDPAMRRLVQDQKIRLTRYDGLTS